MAETPAPTPQQAAPVPPDVQSTQAAPDLSGVTQPGPNAAAPPPPGPANYLASAQEANTAGQQNMATAQKIAQTDTTIKPGPHAQLRAMVEGLAIGLSSSAKALATHGEEGGAPEVQQYYANKASQQREAQAFADARKNSQVQQQIMLGDTNFKMGQQYALMASLPDEVALKHTQVKEAEQNLATSGQQSQISLADFMSTHFGATPGEVTGQAGAPGAAGAATSANPTAVANSKNLLARVTGSNGVAVTVLGADDPSLKAAQAVLQDPNATPQAINQAGQNLQAAVQQKQGATAAQSKMNEEQTNDPVYKLTTPEALAQPGVQASIQAKLQDPTISAKDKVRLTNALGQAAVAQANAITQAKLKAKAEQDAKSGDPEQAAHNLIDHLTTVDDLRLRGATEDFINTTVRRANQLDPKYNAKEASQFAKVAGNEANNAFFGNVNSLVSPGGTIDQLANRSKNISQSEYKLLNEAKNWFDAQTGKPAVAGVTANGLGVIDDAAKIMGGGIGSDASRALVLHAIDPSLSPEQRETALQALKDAVNSQKQARIGNNYFLRDMYGNTTEMSSASNTNAASTKSVNGVSVPSDASEVITDDAGKPIGYRRVGDPKDKMRKLQ